ncbi:MAG: PilT/PilU family type 4a pilus ATPase [Oscillospiraceae bacterium]|nr:PilT/PilU family type 4a pilus ATPase [Oscillospiraceae bacterium]MCI6025879.1 PilT/PilU family type 4a pilus ATPase [Oscillospiraceae bacterium]MCM0705346.1 PilT/PilU family type 4a pilus ATPase [Faecalicatena sp. BF-R-105]MDY3219596.1 PilT/PilU family type 4a pilus ATPase [Candidatus Fimivivens sp.]SFJ01467.1 twitching motility protein PilT [Ruminococcaceae bacterium D5]
MNTLEFLRAAVEEGASDLFVIAGLPFSMKCSGTLLRRDENRLSPEDTASFIDGIYELAHRGKGAAFSRGDDDFSFSLPGVSRFRASVYQQRGTLAAVIRIVRFELPDPAQLGIPGGVLSLADRTRGLVLVTGPAGSGKSTTLACIIDRINTARSAHIITLEDPLEYLHRHRKSIVSQREISTDTESYVTALRASLRQAPDVILLGEMRDHETIGVAMTAAETGHLVLSTLHTVGAANAIDRVVDAFPPNQQGQVRVQLAQVLQAVVSQQLVPTEQGGEAAVFEIMLVNTAIRNMIRESKTHQLENAMISASNEGMVTMDQSLMSLYQQGIISKKTLLLYCTNPDTVSRRVGP